MYNPPNPPLAGGTTSRHRHPPSRRHPSSASPLQCGSSKGSSNSKAAALMADQCFPQRASEGIASSLECRLRWRNRSRAGRGAGPSGLRMLTRIQLGCPASYSLQPISTRSNSPLAFAVGSRRCMCLLRFDARATNISYPSHSPDHRLSDWPAWVDTPHPRMSGENARPHLAAESVDFANKVFSSKSAEEVWHDEWREQFECWFIALPPPMQTQLGACMGALGLHLSSRLDAAWRAAQRLLNRQVGSATSLGTSIEPNCKWIVESDGGLELPAFPEFPDSLDFSLPPIPRLLPDWQHLQSLIIDEGNHATLTQPPLGQKQQRQQQWTWWALGAGFVSGVGAAAVVGLTAATWRRRCYNRQVSAASAQTLASPSKQGGAAGVANGNQCMTSIGMRAGRLSLRLGGKTSRRIEQTSSISMDRGHAVR